MGKGSAQGDEPLPGHVTWQDLWLGDPQKHDFPAAADYLDLILDSATVERLVDGLRRGTTVLKKAKDLMRAGELELLSAENMHVRENIGKVLAGTKLSPVLLVRGPRLIVADGYHRICAAYHLTEDLVVPCRITGP
ncbi:hypothetical protein GXW82_14315 [Streptacidiphilus sp. 4-A2]|nr:hypothetical protein [Streptacidiphilus sp. 4-A2]